MRQVRKRRKRANKESYILRGEGEILSDAAFGILMIVLVVFILLVGCLAMASYWDDMNGE